MLRSFDEARANPPIPFGPAVDDQGIEWENTTLATFLESMDAWLTDVGWTAHDRHESPVWAALSIPEGVVVGGQDDLRRYLVELCEWASDPRLPADQLWAEAAQALRAGRAYE